MNIKYLSLMNKIAILIVIGVTGLAYKNLVIWSSQFAPMAQTHKVYCVIPASSIIRTTVCVVPQF